MCPPPHPLKEFLIIESFPKCKFSLTPAKLSQLLFQLVQFLTGCYHIFPPWKIKCYGFNSRVQGQSQGKWEQPGVFNQIEVWV